MTKRKAFEGIICSNRLQTGDDVRELSSCNSLSVLDLSHNLLEDPEVHFAFFCEKSTTTIAQSIGPFKLSLLKVLEILASMPELHVLNMSNNHIQRTTGE